MVSVRVTGMIDLPLSSLYLWATGRQHLPSFFFE